MSQRFSSHSFQFQGSNYFRDFTKYIFSPIVTNETPQIFGTENKRISYM